MTKLHHKQRGTSLIEVLVSLVVLALGLLGVAGMQMSALRSNQVAYEMSAATMLASSIAERMQANRKAANGGEYNLAMASGTCTGPSGTSLAKVHLRNWIAEMQTTGMLGSSSCGSVNCNAGVCQIVVQWTDSRAVVGSAEVLSIPLEVRL